MEHEVRPQTKEISNQEVFSMFEKHREKSKEYFWEDKFVEYYKIAIQRPTVISLAHRRVYDMIKRKGTKEIPDSDGAVSYNFFTEQIYGIEGPLEQLVSYFRSAGRRLDVRKRILLLMGPVGGGKSTIVDLLKKGEEEYTRTDDGAVYAIKGCPMHEEPLHLVPHEYRADIEKKYGLYIEGDLCPHCRVMLRDVYNGKQEDVMVERITFSEKERIGIGTFTPSDPKSQDISELTGSIDLATISDYGVESDPRAFRFDGELNIANRGIMEFVEMLKCDEKFLYGLLTLSQEQNIKTGRFAMIYADEVVVSHTNETEYRKFQQDKKSEALQDRIILVKIPYNLRVDDEVKIYEKLILQGDLKGMHVAPHALRTASEFAVLSRLISPKKEGMSLDNKLDLYNGKEAVGEWKQKEVRELKKAGEQENEGMDGVSPRYIINRLSATLAKEGAECINAIDALRSLRDGMTETNWDSKTKDARLNFLGTAKSRYDDEATKEVKKAFIPAYPERALDILNSYLDNAQASVRKEKLKDPVTGDEKQPDEKFMRSLEEQIAVSQNGAKQFREDVLISVTALVRRGKTFDLDSNERLREAIEKQLFANLGATVKITAGSKIPNKETERKRNEVIEILIKEQNYCKVCAPELIEYVGELLNR